MAAHFAYAGTRKLAALVALAVALRVVLLFILPPLVDVYYYDTQAVSALMSGSDPYGHLYTGIPLWLATQGAARVYAYFPGVVLFLAPAGTLFDIRVGLIGADVVVAWSLYALGGQRSRTASLAFLLAPWGFLFSTSYPDNTLVAMAFLGLYLAAEIRGRGLLASALLGLSLASSLFVWLVYPFLLVSYFRRKRVKDAAVSVLVAVLIILPFVVWNFSSFIFDTVTFQFVRPVQTLVTPEAFGINFNPTLSGILATAIGLQPPLLLKAALASVLLVVLAVRTKDMSSLLFNASIFLVAGILLLANDFSWWYLELPFQTLLASWVLGHKEVPESHANP